MQRHLDCGKHVHALESATMLDKAVRGFATSLEGHFTSVSQFGEDTTSTDAPDGLGSQTGSDKQSKILGQAKRVLDKLIGESSKSSEVNRITARDKTGKCIFPSVEFLITARQITSIFSRLDAKRSLSVHSHGKRCSVC